MNRGAIVGLVLVTALGLPVAGYGGTTQYATPSGQIVIGDLTGLLVAPVGPNLIFSVYIVPEIPADPVALKGSFPPGPSADPVIWGYEAASASARILAYNDVPPVTPVADCVPPGSINGRGLAYDPVDGNLWYTTVTFSNFVGDGLIRKTTPPQTGGCTLVTQIPFGDGPGGTIQDDIGALDVDGDSHHIWAAGYKPITVDNQLRSYLYLVNRNNGSIIKSCWVPFKGGGVGNDSLTFARLDGLPGSGRYLLTDAGQANTIANRLEVIDITDCKSGAQVTPVADFSKAVPMSGIDLEWPGLMATDLENLYNLGGPPFSSATPQGAWGNTTEMEDVSVCAAGATLGATEVCPY